VRTPARIRRKRPVDKPALINRKIPNATLNAPVTLPSHRLHGSKRRAAAAIGNDIAVVRGLPPLAPAAGSVSPKSEYEAV
jgi:hypothetical protein